jgi:hypothetical protein
MATGLLHLLMTGVVKVRRSGADPGKLVIPAEADAAVLVRAVNRREAGIP